MFVGQQAKQGLGCMCLRKQCVAVCLGLTLVGVSIRFKCQTDGIFWVRIFVQLLVQPFVVDGTDRPNYCWTRWELGLWISWCGLRMSRSMTVLIFTLRLGSCEHCKIVFVKHSCMIMITWHCSTH
jgi:hypothetical protein